MDGGEELVWNSFVFFFLGGMFLVCIHLQKWADMHGGECVFVWNLRLHSLLINSSRLKTGITFVEFTGYSMQYDTNCATE